MIDKLRDIQVSKLTERAKELRCIYRVVEALRDEDAELIRVFSAIIEAIPPGYQYPTICEACILFEGKEYPSTDFRITEWMQKAEIVIDSHVAGEIQVCYSQDVFGDGLVFLPDEQKLLNTIAEHLSRFIFQRRLKKALESSWPAEPEVEPGDDNSLLAYVSDEHWRWRSQVAEKIAAMIDRPRFGVVDIYLIGSAKTAQAGPSSDIDLLIHFRGDAEQQNQLRAWLEGWGLGLAELNFSKTGYRTTGSLIDYHIITDDDIKQKTSFAVMIDSTENSARLLPHD